MIQGILVVLIFISAVSYLAWTIYRQLSARTACTTGCGKCSVVDFKKIEAELKSKNL